MGITNFSRDMFSNFYPLHEMDIYFVTMSRYGNPHSDKSYIM